MFAKSCPKVSFSSHLSWESYDAKFGMDEYTQNNYGVTLKNCDILPRYGALSKVGHFH